MKVALPPKTHTSEIVPPLPEEHLFLAFLATQLRRVVSIQSQLDLQRLLFMYRFSHVATVVFRLWWITTWSTPEDRMRARLHSLGIITGHGTTFSPYQWSIVALFEQLTSHEFALNPTFNNDDVEAYDKSVYSMAQVSLDRIMRHPLKVSALFHQAKYKPSAWATDVAFLIENSGRTERTVSKEGVEVWCVAQTQAKPTCANEFTIPQEGKFLQRIIDVWTLIQYKENLQAEIHSLSKDGNDLALAWSKFDGGVITKLLQHVSLVQGSGVISDPFVWVEQTILDIPNYEALPEETKLLIFLAETPSRIVRIQNGLDFFIMLQSFQKSLPDSSLFRQWWVGATESPAERVLRRLVSLGIVETDFNTSRLDFFNGGSFTWHIQALLWRESKPRMDPTIMTTTLKSILCVWSLVEYIPSAVVEAQAKVCISVALQELQTNKSFHVGRIGVILQAWQASACNELSPEYIRACIIPHMLKHSEFVPVWNSQLQLHRLRLKNSKRRSVKSLHLNKSSQPHEIKLKPGENMNTSIYVPPQGIDYLVKRCIVKALESLENKKGFTWKRLKRVVLELNDPSFGGDAIDDIVDDVAERMTWHPELRGVLGINRPIENIVLKSTFELLTQESSPSAHPPTRSLSAPPVNDFQMCSDGPCQAEPIPNDANESIHLAAVNRSDVSFHSAQRDNAVENYDPPSNIETLVDQCVEKVLLHLQKKKFFLLARLKKFVRKLNTINVKSTEELDIVVRDIAESMATRPQLKPIMSATGTISMFQLRARTQTEPRDLLFHGMVDIPVSGPAPKTLQLIDLRPTLIESSRHVSVTPPTFEGGNVATDTYVPPPDIDRIVEHCTEKVLECLENKTLCTWARLKTMVLNLKGVNFGDTAIDMIVDDIAQRITRNPQFGAVPGVKRPVGRIVLNFSSKMPNSVCGDALKLPQRLQKDADPSQAIPHFSSISPTRKISTRDAVLGISRPIEHFTEEKMKQSDLLINSDDKLYTNITPTAEVVRHAPPSTPNSIIARTTTYVLPTGQIVAVNKNPLVVESQTYIPLHGIAQEGELFRFLYSVRMAISTKSDLSIRLDEFITQTKDFDFRLGGQKDRLVEIVILEMQLLGLVSGNGTIELPFTWAASESNLAEVQYDVDGIPDEHLLFDQSDLERFLQFFRSTLHHSSVFLQWWTVSISPVDDTFHRLHELGILHRAESTQSFYFWNIANLFELLQTSSAIKSPSVAIRNSASKSIDLQSSSYMTDNAAIFAAIAVEGILQAKKRFVIETKQKLERGVMPTKDALHVAFDGALMHLIEANNSRLCDLEKTYATDTTHFETAESKNSIDIISSTKNPTALLHLSSVCEGDDTICRIVSAPLDINLLAQEKQISTNNTLTAQLDPFSKNESTKKENQAADAACVKESPAPTSTNDVIMYLPPSYLNEAPADAILRPMLGQPVVKEIEDYDSKSIDLTSATYLSGFDVILNNTELCQYESDVVDFAGKFTFDICKRGRPIVEFALVSAAAQKSATWLKDVLSILSTSERIERVHKGTQYVWQLRQNPKPCRIVIPNEGGLVKYLYRTARNKNTIAMRELRAHINMFAMDRENGPFLAWWEQNDASTQVVSTFLCNLGLLCSNEIGNDAFEWTASNNLQDGVETPLPVPDFKELLASLAENPSSLVLTTKQPELHHLILSFRLSTASLLFRFWWVTSSVPPEKTVQNCLINLGILQGRELLNIILYSCRSTNISLPPPVSDEDVFAYDENVLSSSNSILARTKEKGDVKVSSIMRLAKTKPCAWYCDVLYLIESSGCVQRVVESGLSIWRAKNHCKIPKWESQFNIPNEASLIWYILSDSVLPTAKSELKIRVEAFAAIDHEIFGTWWSKEGDIDIIVHMLQCVSLLKSSTKSSLFEWAEKSSLILPFEEKVPDEDALLCYLAQTPSRLLVIQSALDLLGVLHLFRQSLSPASVFRRWFVSLLTLLEI
ncbi:Aste57867_23604 [Aphanomyces stellatus]|uniref:Aste57867_23604 protein n=1 Tax=Aphanomyces stellatus TaxID=120398 RepID=A0A485LPT3_9STRA|nr:hypothetical protein As57867_023532 [Aphanomyces stellatus]VFU00249.1 Aste57867_23604 [Aphanomyces stellatus]